MEALTQVKVKLSDFPTNPTNPFINDAIEIINEHTTRKRRYFSSSKVLLDVVNTNTGEVEGVQSFTKYQEVDDDAFTKIFISNLQNFFDLGKTAIRVFCFIQKKLKPNTDFFIFDLSECKDFTHLSAASVYKGLAELVKNEFIARGNKDIIYFINPQIFFNGDRVIFAKAIKKKHDKEEDKNQLKLPL